MIHAETAQTADSHSWPAPTDMPIAPVSQMLAAVVSPSTCSASARFRIVPAPMKPMPVATPWITRLRSAMSMPGLGRKQDEQRGAERDEHVRAQSGRLARAFTLPPEQRPEERRDRDACDDAHHLRAVRQMKEIFDLHKCAIKISAFGRAARMSGRRESDLTARSLALAAAWRSPSAPAGAQTQTPAPLAAAGEAAAELDRIRSLLVSWRGSLVVERYYNGARASSPANIKSASKSVISALVGIAIDRGSIEGVRQPIARLLSSRCNGPKVDPSQARDHDRGSADDAVGAPVDEQSLLRRVGAERNWVQYALDRPLLAEPGTYMDYSTGSSHLLSAILTKATGKSTWQYAQEVLAKPLGFSLAQWPRDPQGIYFGGNDMLMTPRQMVAFGELYLKKGSVAGARSSRRRGSRRRSCRARARAGATRRTATAGGRASSRARTCASRGVSAASTSSSCPALDLVVVTTSSSTVDESRRSHRRTVFDIVEQLVIEPLARSADL